MPSHTEATVALLHVSALVGALTLAYVKLDKLWDGRPEAYEQALQDIKAVAQEMALESGLLSMHVHKGDRKRIPIIFPACVICIIADQPRPIGRLMSVLHFFYRQYHIPFLCYFRRHRHIHVGNAMAVFSVAMFFLFAAALIWELEWPSHPAIIATSYGIFVCGTAWLMMTNYFSSQLEPKRLKLKCDELVALVRLRKSEWEDRILKMLDDFDAFDGPKEK